MYMYTSEGWRCHDKKYCIWAFLTCQKEILLEDCSAKTGTERILKPSLRKEHPCGDWEERIAPP